MYSGTERTAKEAIVEFSKMKIFFGGDDEFIKNPTKMTNKVRTSK